MPPPAGARKGRPYKRFVTPWEWKLNGQGFGVRTSKGFLQRKGG